MLLDGAGALKRYIILLHLLLHFNLFNAMARNVISSTPKNLRNGYQMRDIRFGLEIGFPRFWQFEFCCPQAAGCSVTLARELFRSQLSLVFPRSTTRRS